MNKRQSLPWDNPRFKNWVALVRAHNAVERALSKALQPLDLKPAHLDILLNAFRFPGLSQQELARKLLVGRSNVTMLLPQLERRGLITRTEDEKDKRVWRLKLTGPGLALTSQAIDIHVALIDKVMGASSQEACDVVGDVMLNVAKLLEAPVQSASKATKAHD
jgi:DNA-binding MarR family transcriptional regulator